MSLPFRTTLLALLTTWILHVLAPVLHLAELTGHGEPGGHSHAGTCCGAHHHCHSHGGREAEQHHDDEESSPALPGWDRPAHAHDVGECALCQQILQWVGSEPVDAAPARSRRLVAAVDGPSVTTSPRVVFLRPCARGPPRVS